MFNKKNGYYIIIIDGKEFYMRNHPKFMLESMKQAGHNMFVIFEDEREKRQYDATIEDLENYIKEVEENV